MKKNVLLKDTEIASVTSTNFLVITIADKLNRRKTYSISKK